MYKGKRELFLSQTQKKEKGKPTNLKSVTVITVIPRRENRHTTPHGTESQKKAEKNVILNQSFLPA